MSTWTCPEHNQAKVVPAGVSSRTGKPYPSFMCCPVRGCEQRPPKERPQNNAQTFAPGAPRPAVPHHAPQKPLPDWERIAEGKCRSLAISAWIQSGKPLQEFWGEQADIVAYMMTGRTPFDEGQQFPEE